MRYSVNSCVQMQVSYTLEQYETNRLCCLTQVWYRTCHNNVSASHNVETGRVSSKFTIRQGKRSTKKWRVQSNSPRWGKPKKSDLPTKKTTNILNLKTGLHLSRAQVSKFSHKFWPKHKISFCPTLKYSMDSLILQQLSLKRKSKSKR